MEEILYETVNHGLKLPTSSGERRISEPSTVSSEVQFVVRHQSLLALCAGLVGFALGGSFALQAVSRQKGSLQIFVYILYYVHPETWSKMKATMTKIIQMGCCNHFSTLYTYIYIL